MKINFANRQHLLIVVAGAAVALFILDSVAFTPLTKLWQAHSTEIAKLQKSVGDGRALIARAAQTERIWSDMKANALPQDAAQAEQVVYAAFDRWGRANNIETSSQKPQWKRGATDKYSLLEFRFDATGSLSTLSRFMYDLESSPLALRVDSIELTARDESGQRLSLGLIVSGLRLSPLEPKR